MIILLLVGCGQQGTPPVGDLGAKPADKTKQDNVRSTDSENTRSANKQTKPSNDTTNLFDQRGEKYAILIGVANYSPESGLRPLSYTEQDVTRLGGVLASVGFRPENIIVMSDSAGRDNPDRLPERAKIQQHLTSLLRDRGQADTVLIAFAGHGIQFKGDEDSFFCPLDANLDRRDSLISMGDLYKQLTQCPAAFKLILSDACRDAPTTTATRGLTLLKRGEQTQLTPPGGVAVFYSCSAGQVAFEDSQLKHGVYFNFVINGLLGAADLDDDRQVTLPELEQHVMSGVSKYVETEFAGRQQMPNLKGDRRGLAVIADVTKVEKMPGPVDVALEPVEQVIAPAAIPETPFCAPVGNISTFVGHNNPVYLVAFSPDGQHIASATRQSLEPEHDTAIRLWDMSQRSPVLTFKDEQEHLHKLAFSQDGKQILGTAYYPRSQLSLWDVASGERTKTHVAGDDIPRFHAAVMHPDGRSIVGVGRETGLTSSFMIYDMLREQPRAVRSAEPSGLIEITSDGRRAVTGGRAIHLWDVSSATRVATIETTGTPLDLAISRNGGVIAIWQRPRPTNPRFDVVSIWRVFDDEGFPTTPYHARSLIVRRNVTQGNYMRQQPALAVSPDGQWIAFGRESELVLVNVETGKSEEWRGHTGFILSIAISPDSKVVATGSEDKTIGVWRLPEPEKFAPARGATMEADLNKVVAQGYGVASADSPTLFQSRFVERFLDSGQESSCVRCTFSFDGNVAAWMDRSDNIRVWNLTTNTISDPIKGAVSIGLVSNQFEPGGAAYIGRGFRLSPDGQLLVNVFPKAIQLWETSTGKLVHEIQLAVRQFLGIRQTRDVSFAPSGRFVAVGDSGGKVIVLDVETPETVKIIDISKKELRRVEVFDDGKKLLACGAFPPFIDLWDVEANKLVREFIQIPSAPPAIVAVAPDGSEFAGHFNNSIFRWNMQTGELLPPLIADVPQVDDIVYSANGKRILVHVNKKNLLLFENSSGDMILRVQDIVDMKPTDWISENGCSIRASIFCGHPKSPNMKIREFHLAQ